MSKHWRLQDMTFRQWAVAYLCAVVLGGALSTLARHWSWPFLDLPIAFWRGFLQTSAAILPGAVAGSAVCAGGISNPRKPKA